MPAFEAAMEKADGIELDVRLAKCGTPVVAHDDTLDRVFGVPYRIDEMTADELALLRPSGSMNEARSGLYPPTLAQVLRLIPADFPLNIEIKAPKVEPRTPTRAVADVLKGFPHDPLVSCFNPLELARMAVHRRGTRLGLLFHHESSFALREALVAPVLAMANLEALHPNWKLVSPDLIERAHERGWAVNVWTLNDPVRAKWLAQEGVDSLITDCPGELRKALAQ